MNKDSTATTVRAKVTVANMRGLHMRFAGDFVAFASKFKSSIALCKGRLRADGKSILDLVSLSAAPGTSLDLLVEGEDAESAAKAVVEFFSNYNGDR